MDKESYGRYRQFKIRCPLRSTSLPEIMNVVEEVTQVTREEMYKKRGNEKVMIARHLFHLIAYTLTDCDHQRVAVETGKQRSTTTVSIKTAIGLLKTNDEFKETYSNILSIINKKFNLNAVTNN